MYTGQADMCLGTYDRFSVSAEHKLWDHKLLLFILFFIIGSKHSLRHGVLSSRSCGTWGHKLPGVSRFESRSQRQSCVMLPSHHRKEVMIDGDLFNHI